jgi:hypothetical protein
VQGSCDDENTSHFHSPYYRFCFELLCYSIKEFYHMSFVLFKVLIAVHCENHTKRKNTKRRVDDC